MLEQQEAGKRVTLQTVLMEADAAALVVEGADWGLGGSELEAWIRAPIAAPTMRVRERMAKRAMVATRGFRLEDLG